jgi:hypothetical protein
VIHKKIARIIGIVLKPVARVAEPEAIAPRVHVRHQPISPDALDAVSKNNLQETHRGFFQVVAARISIETIPALAVHAYDVTGLVQEGVHRRVGSDEYRPPYYSGFGVTPETAGYGCIVRLNDQFEAKTLE